MGARIAGCVHPKDLYHKIKTALADQDWEYWDPYTLLVTLGVQNSHDQDKLSAIQGLVKNPWLAVSDYFAFEKIAHAFCNNPVVAEVDQPLSLEEILYSVRQIQAILTEAGIQAEFKGEVPSYVAVVATEEGWDALPEDLAFASELFTHLASMVSRKFEAEAKAALKALAGMSKDEVSALLDKIAPDTSAGANQLRKYAGLLLYDPTLTCAK